MKRIRKSTWLCICVLPALFLSGCTTRTAVNEYYGLCLMVQDGLYLCDNSIKEEALPEGFSFAGEVASTCTSGILSAELEAFGLPADTALYRDPDNAQYIYVCVAAYGQHRYRKLAAFAPV